MQPLIINAAITGMIPKKKDTPYVPIHPEEIIAEVKRVRDAGATIVHIHARDEHENPTYEKEVYGEIFQGIREECPEILISGTCSGRDHKEFWQRSQVLEMQPDLASLTLGSLNFPKQVSMNSPEMIQQLAIAMRERNIMAELEIFDMGMANYAHYLIRKGLLEGPQYANILLGSLGSMPATPENLCTIVRALPENTTWAATGIGRYQFEVNALAIAMGGHVRVGLEDALYYSWENRDLATNVGLIDRVTKVAAAMGREIATAAQTREMIGCKSRSHLRLLAA